MDLKNSKLLQLIDEEEKAKKTLKILERELQINQNMRHVLTKKALTSRLCSHGKLLERYFSPDDFTDEQIDMILFGLLQNPRNQKDIELLKSGGHISW